MSGFTFDAEAALRRAREVGPLPNPPNPPNREGADDSGLGRLGRLGTPPRPPTTQEGDPDLARELFEERAAIREFDGGQDRAHAEREAAREAGLTILAAWRREADDPFNPATWR